MDVGLDTDWFHFGIFVLVLFFVWRLIRLLTLKRGAQNLVASIKSVYAGDHDLQAADPRDFGWMNQSHYESATKSLEDRGFIHLEDIEDLTLSRAFPRTRTFIRSMIGAEGTLQAGVYDISPRGSYRFLQLLGAISRDFRTIDLVTELTNGRFVLSSTADKKMASGNVPPEADAEFYPRDMPIDEYLEAHVARVQSALDAEPGLDILRVHTARESRDSQCRLQRHINRFKGGGKYLTPDDIARAADDPKSPAVKALSSEVEKEKKARGDG